MTEPLEKIVEAHVTRSREESADAGALEHWQSGARAKEQAEQIVSSLVSDAIKELEGFSSGK